MSLLTDAWAVFVADVKDGSLPTLVQAADGLQVSAPTLDQQDAEDWFDAVADEYNRLGIINMPTYNRLRNKVDTVAADESNALFLALQSGIRSLPETAAVSKALRRENRTGRRADIPDHVTTLETARDLVPAADQDLIDAYNVALAALASLDLELEAELANP